MKFYINGLQYTIFIGNIDKEKYLYNIEFILDFNSYNDCENQKKIMLSKDIFNENRDNDYLSPIFNMDDKIVGYCYKKNKILIILFVIIIMIIYQVIF